MAQRTGVDGFLTPPAKVASAGVALALATAALFALAGCGGGSDDSETNGGTAASTPGQSSPPGKAGEGSSPQAAEDSLQSKDSSPRNPSNPTTGAAEQDQRVVVPKGEPERPLSAEQREGSTLATIALQSPAIRSPAPEAVGALPRDHTCDGKDSWPALQWQGIPAGSTELVLFAMNTEPVGGEIFFDWALAGLDPSLGGIEAARLPPGAILGQNSHGKRGYSICPPAGKETYMFALYALPRRLSPPRGFDPAALRKQVLGLAGDVGFLPATYARG